MSMAGFHITEDCAEVYLQNESGTEFLQLARRLHDYLQQGQRLPARSLFEATDNCKEISREAFDALAKHRMENTGEVSGLFELDFDARTFSALNSQSLQMAERALLSPDELKNLPKGNFIVMKTGTHPMRTRLQLFLNWGITFGEPYTVPERANRAVAYANRVDLERNLPKSAKAEEAAEHRGYAVSGHGGMAHEPVQERTRKRGKSIKSMEEENT